MMTWLGKLFGHKQEVSNTKSSRKRYVRLSGNQRRAIIELYTRRKENRVTQKSLAKTYNVSESTIQKVIRDSKRF